MGSLFTYVLYVSHMFYLVSYMFPSHVEFYHLNDAIAFADECGDLDAFIYIEGYNGPIFIY